MQHLMKNFLYFLLVGLVFSVLSASAFMRSPRVLSGRRISMNPIMVVREITSLEEFENLVTYSSSSLPIIVDYQKSKCRACARAAPIFEALSEKYGNEAKFYKVSVEGFKGALGLMKANGVKSVPTFQIWRGGEQLQTIHGAHLDDVEGALRQPAAA
eukprot:gene7053-7799_t